MQSPPSGRTVHIIGTGFAGMVFARALVAAGWHVVMYEKGPELPYPQAPQFDYEIGLRFTNPEWEVPRDLNRVTTAGDYRFPVEGDRVLGVGGTGTHWSAITLRMPPTDFALRTRTGSGVDWPIDYDELEPYYGMAELLLGVSGTTRDDPHAPRRSTPYPLPPFELGFEDRRLADRLDRAGIHMHTTPQARTRQPFDGRPACQNYGTCGVCPIGARYSPLHHLERLVATGRCIVHPRTSVRRLLAAPDGRISALLIQGEDEVEPREVPVSHVVLAAGALESIRLLLLSRGPHAPDGVGNAQGLVGRGFTLHHAWFQELRFDTDMFSGRFGGFTGQISQFRQESGARHGGLKIILSDTTSQGRITSWESVAEVDRQLELRRRTRALVLTGEAAYEPDRRVTLSTERDRFGDQFAHLDYRLTDFDLRTFEFARRTHQRILEATGAVGETLPDEPTRFGSGAHHMGGCALGLDPTTGVCDGYGKVFGVRNLYVGGSSLFPNSSGPVNPTLTIVALALRSAERMVEELRAA